MKYKSDPLPVRISSTEKVPSPVIHKILHNADIGSIISRHLDSTVALRQTSRGIRSSIAFQPFIFTANSDTFKKALLKDYANAPVSSSSLKSKADTLKIGLKKTIATLMGRSFSLSMDYKKELLNRCDTIFKELYSIYLTMIKTKKDIRYMLDIVDTLYIMVVDIYENRRKLGDMERELVYNNMNMYKILHYEFRKMILSHYLILDDPPNVLMLNNIKEIFANNTDVLLLYKGTDETRQTHRDFINIVYYCVKRLEKLTQDEYSYIQKLMALSNKSYEDFKKDTSLQKKIYENCRKYILNKKGIQFQLSDEHKNINLSMS